MEDHVLAEWSRWTYNRFAWTFITLRTTQWRPWSHYKV